MARSKTPKKRSSKSSSKTGIDLNDPVKNAVVTTLTLIILGCIGALCPPAEDIAAKKDNNSTFNVEHLNDITESGYLTKLFQIFNSETDLHAIHWKISFVLTLHLINSVRSSGGYWVNDIIGAVFKACGSSMMLSFINNDKILDWTFWKYVPYIIILWYIVNKNIPRTGINVWKVITDNVSNFVPLQRIMDLCSLYVNYSILQKAITKNLGGLEEKSLLYIPQFSKIMFIAVAVHCATDFFNQDGFNFSMSGCSETAERAVVVAFWIATKGLETLIPPIGNITGKVVGHVAHVGAGTDENTFTVKNVDHFAFLWIMILLNEIFGEFLAVKPHRMIMDFLNDFLL